MKSIIFSLRLYFIILILIVLESFIFNSTSVQGQINTTQFPYSSNYVQSNLQFNYPFSGISQNTYSSGLSGLSQFSSNLNPFYTPFSTNLSYPSINNVTGSLINITGPARTFYNLLGNYPNLNYLSSTFLFPTVPNIMSPLNFPTTFSPFQLFPTVLFPSPINTVLLPSPINIPTRSFPLPFPFPFPFPPQPAPQPKPQPKPQKLFQSEYTNFAWGYQHSGWYINDDGKVYTFKNTGNSSEDGDNIEFVYTIDPIILEEKRSLISAASQGPFSERTNTAFDFGSFVYSAFLGDTEILLKETGDWTQENQSSSAIDLVTWLQEIEAELSQ